MLLCFQGNATNKKGLTWNPDRRIDGLHYMAVHTRLQGLQLAGTSSEMDVRRRTLAQE